MFVSWAGKSWGRYCLVLLACFFLAGCFATATKHGPPPMDKRPGQAPEVAMLPIENTNDPELANLVSEKIKTCLQERNVFQFAGQEQVDEAAKASGYNFGTMLGLDAEQYASLAGELGVTYTMHGTLTVRKSLTFSGWRKDVDVYVYLSDSSGNKVDSWRSMTDFTWAKGEDAVNAEKMAESPANHICAKILEREY
ncbi:MAG: hypothetical protein ACLFMP_05540 [Desulfonatronovibrionaceae bacterium]